MDSFQSLESAQANTTLDRCTRGYSATTSERDPYSVDESISQHKPSSRFDGTKGQDSVQKPLRATSQSTQAQAVTNNDVELRPHTGFRNALYNVLSLLPDELHIRDLLRPLDGTGEEKIREMGLRTRSYKTLFEAWGALHLVANGKEMYIRDDVVQSLRRHPELADDFQMSLAQIIRSYEAYRSYMARLSTLLFPWTAPYFSDHLLLYAQLYSGGRGIVFSAGDHQAPFLLTSIPTLRQLGCDLPIEVMYLGDDDLSEDFRTDLESLSGVITRDLSQMVNDKGWKLAGWAGKPFAILFSSFREVIFIDADSLFFQTPEVLFDDPSYLETGALFFRDRLMMPELKKKWLQKVLPKPISKKATQSRFWTGESGHMQESGVVVVDKCKHFVALLLVTRMNGPDRDGDAAKGKIGVYDLVYGKLLPRPSYLFSIRCATKIY
jgi:alpha 1,3-mannosyltransferase